MSFQGFASIDCAARRISKATATVRRYRYTGTHGAFACRPAGCLEGSSSTRAMDVYAPPRESSIIPVSIRWLVLLHLVSFLAFIQYRRSDRPAPAGCLVSRGGLSSPSSAYPNRRVLCFLGRLSPINVTMNQSNFPRNQSTEQLTNQRNN